MGAQLVELVLRTPLGVVMFIVGFILLLLGLLKQVVLSNTTFPKRPPSYGTRAFLVVIGLGFMIVPPIAQIALVTAVPVSTPMPTLVPANTPTVAASSTLTSTPTATATPTVTSTPTPTATPTPVALQFEGPVCEVSADFNDLTGERVFLRGVEFERLGFPVGTKVILAVTIDGVTNYRSDLILDSDTELSICVLRLRESVRKQLNPILEKDVDIDDPKQRAIRQWQITVER